MRSGVTHVVNCRADGTLQGPGSLGFANHPSLPAGIMISRLHTNEQGGSAGVEGKPRITNPIQPWNMFQG